MTSWDPDSAAAYVAANGLETAFYSRYPNAYGAQHAADFMAIWLNKNVAAPDGPEGRPIDTLGAVAEEQAIMNNPNYVLPFTPVPNSTPAVFPAASATRDPGLPMVDDGANPQPGKKSVLPLLIAAGVVAWLTLRD